ncbi:MAG TPA: hypothetical protein VIX86_05220 [Streptosporangiaceae bacterium]
MRDAVSGQPALASPARPRLLLAVLAVLALLAAACGPAHATGGSGPAAGATSPAARSTAATAPLPAGRVGPRSAVPWTRVGPGWVLAQYTTSGNPDTGTPGPARPVDLYLVDPAGGRYLMYRWPAGQGQQWQLVDWSGDKARALFQIGGTATVVQLALAQGTMSRFSLPVNVSAQAYTLPEGTNLLAVTQPPGAGPAELERFDLTGALRATLARGPDIGRPASSADGTTLAVGASTGVELVSNAGGRPRLLRVPGVDRRLGCSAVRWWDASTLLAQCIPARASAPQLWLVPDGGGAPSSLTPVRSGRGPDLGDINAWRLPSGLYVQALGPCGTEFIARQAANGSLTQVSIAGTSGNNRVLGVTGGRMLVQAQVGCPGSSSLLWLDPATGAAQTLLAPARGQRGVLGAVPYGRPNG